MGEQRDGDDDNKNVQVEGSRERVDIVRATFMESMDDLNAALVQAELAFRRQGFGVRAFVPLFDGNKSTRLGFGKIDNAWHFLVEFTSAEGVQTSLLSRASRSYRMLAATRLEALHAALVDEMETQVEAVERATRDVLAFAAKLRESEATR